MRWTSLFGIGCAFTWLVGCSKPPAAVSPAPQPAPVMVAPAGGTDLLPLPAGPLSDPAADCPQPGPVAPLPVPPVLPRFVAFTALSCAAGNLFVYDDAAKDVYVLNAALAGLDGVYPGVTPFQLQAIEPTFFGAGKVLFDYGGRIFYYDMITEERVTLALDAFCFGAHPRISETGTLVYINREGCVVMIPGAVDTPFLGKPRVLSKIAAEIDVQSGLGWPGLPFFRPVCSVDISADGRWIVAAINGKLYLYDVASPNLAQLLPLGGPELGLAPGNISRVTISPDGRLIALTACSGFNERLLILDRASGLLHTAPYPNLGLVAPWSTVANPRFLGDGLYFEVLTPLGARVWRYDVNTELINALVILNNALGEAGTNVLISNPKL